MSNIDNNQPGESVAEFEDEAEVLQPEPLQQSPPLTKGALATLGMDALDRNRVGQVKVSATAGGVAFATAIEVMEFAKLMSVAQTAVPKHLRNNPGMCLAVTFQAVEWRMSPFAVANKSYVVNDRIAYESQLVHAVIEARAPLRERLDCIYEGEGPERTCTIIGKFRDGTERRYTTPKFKDIRVKNSPLYKDDPDQQTFYYGSRSWARKWCPDVLLGIYTKEEMAELPQEAELPGDGKTLQERLKAGGNGDEGHKNGHADSELASVASDTGTIKPAGEQEATTIKAAAGEKAPAGAKADKAKPGKKGATSTAKATKAAADRAQARSDATKAKTAAQTPAEQPAKPQEPAKAEPEKVPKKPKTAAEYQVYCIDWINKGGDPEDAMKRWDIERTTRDECGVRTAMRNDLRFRLENKFGV